MKVIAKRTKDGFLIPFVGELKNIQNEEIEIEIKISSFLKESFTEKLHRTIKKFPKSKLNFKKEWHKHLEEKYNG